MGVESKNEKIIRETCKDMAADSVDIEDMYI